MKKINRNNFIIIIFLVVIFVFFATIALKFFTRQVLVKKFQMDNKFTQFVLMNEPQLQVEGKVEDPGFQYVYVDWQALYPLKEPRPAAETKQSIPIIDSYKTKVDVVKTYINKFSTDFLVHRIELITAKEYYDMAVQWNTVYFHDYNPSYVLGDNYLICPSTSDDDWSASAKALAELNEFCKQQGCDMMFALQPTKVCEIEDKDFVEGFDHAVSNAKNFVSQIKAAGVTVYDHQADIHAEGLNHHSLYFDTDHHWKPEAGLWAVRHLVQFMNENYGYNLPVENVSDELYEKKVYKKWFLGSRGKRVTLARATPDDISLLYPTIPTSFHFEIPSTTINKDCDFLGTYNMKCIEKKDYYNKNPYGIYDYGDNECIKIHNNYVNNGKKLLIIHHSFGNVEVPFFAMTFEYVDSLDIRLFDGSVQSYIEKEKPDMVLVTYDKGEGDIDYSSGTYMYDFH